MAIKIGDTVLHHGESEVTEHIVKNIERKPWYDQDRGHVYLAFHYHLYTLEDTSTKAICQTVEGGKLRVKHS